MNDQANPSHDESYDEAVLKPLLGDADDPPNEVPSEAELVGVEDPFEPPPPPRRIRKPKKGEFAPRGLMLIWCLWLLGSWAGSLWIESTVPAVRLMIFSAVIGLMVMWPVLRLSEDVTKKAKGETSPPAPPPPEDSPADLLSRANTEDGPGTPISMIFADWLCLVLVFQAVVWPLRLSTGWSMKQTIWLDSAVIAWTLLVGAFVAFGCASRHGWRRMAAMVLCLLLLLGEPAAMALLNIGSPRGLGHTWVMRITPLQTLWEETEKPTAWMADPSREIVLAVAAAAVVAWVIVMVSVRRKRMDDR